MKTMSLHEFTEQKSDKNYLYRGQTQKYERPYIIPSVYRGLYQYKKVTDYVPVHVRIRGNENDFYEQIYNGKPIPMGYKCSRIAAATVNNVFGYPLTQALLQQAGYKSEGVDVTTDLGIALFFATHTCKNGKYYLKTDYDRVKSVLFAWEKPKADPEEIMYQNFYTCPQYIPSLEIMKSFDSCAGMEEFVSSLKEFFAAVCEILISSTPPAYLPRGARSEGAFICAPGDPPEAQLSAGDCHPLLKRI